MHYRQLDCRHLAFELEGDLSTGSIRCFLLENVLESVGSLVYGDDVSVLDPDPPVNLAIDHLHTPSIRRTNKEKHLHAGVPRDPAFYLLRGRGLVAIALDDLRKLPLLLRHVLLVAFIP